MLSCLVYIPFGVKVSGFVFVPPIIPLLRTKFILSTAQLDAVPKSVNPAALVLLISIPATPHTFLIIVAACSLVNCSLGVNTPAFVSVGAVVPLVIPSL